MGQKTNAGQKKMIIGIDAGHGGADPGAVGQGGTREKDYCYAVALLVCERLLESRMSVGLVRVGDQGLKASERIKHANSFSHVISIHCNAVADPTVWGSEVIYGAKFPVSFALARSIDAYLGQVVGRSRGVKLSPSPGYPRSLFMVNHLFVPSCLVECDFISNPKRELFLNQNKKDIAKAIAQGIVAHFNQ